MRKRTTIVGVILLAAIVMWALWPESEPMYKGHGLSYWVLARGSGIPAPPGSAASLEHAEAARAIQATGTNAIPYLLTWLQYEKPGALKMLESAIWKGGMFTSPFAKLGRKKETRGQPPRGRVRD